jgi:hypothetical protein
MNAVVTTWAIARPTHQPEEYSHHVPQTRAEADGHNGVLSCAEVQWFAGTSYTQFVCAVDSSETLTKRAVRPR